MKKIAVSAMVVATFFVAANSHAGSTHIWASKNGAFVPWNPFADHTYACISGYGCYSTGTSSTSGGTILSDTHGYADGYQARQYANCTLHYANNGVCHQHSNRVMYRTGKTLPLSVKGYRTSKNRFGITGDVGALNGQFRRCLAEVDGG